MTRALRLLPLLAAACLAGCGDDYQDLHEFMRTTEASLPRQIEPLPEVKPYEPFTYDAFALAEPFKPRPLRQDTADNSKPRGPVPDPNRRKEALEAFPIETLHMVGTLQQNKVTYALVRAENSLYRVRPGDHMGTDNGLVTGVSDTEIKLREIIQDSNGDWTERQSSLQLTDASLESKR